MKYLTNALSLNMLPPSCSLHITVLTTEEVARDVDDAVCAIGHADTAALAGGLLGREIAPNRVTLALVPGDVLLVLQYIGPRLPEGTSTLPEGASVEWRKVVVL